MYNMIYIVFPVTRRNARKTGRITARSTSIPIIYNGVIIPIFKRLLSTPYSKIIKKKKDNESFRFRLNNTDGRRGFIIICTSHFCSTLARRKRDIIIIIYRDATAGTEKKIILYFKLHLIIRVIQTTDVQNV